MASVDGIRAAEQRRYDAQEAERARAREVQEKQLLSVKEDSQEELSKANDEYNSRLLDQKKSAHDEIRKLKEELYDQKGKKFVKDTRDLSDEKRNLENYREEMEKEYQIRSARVEQSAQSKVRTAESIQKDKVDDALAAQRQSHLQELASLQETLDLLKADPKDLNAERARARAEAIQEVTGPGLQEKERIQEAYTRIINRMKELREEERASHTRQVELAHIEANGKASQVLRQQKKDFSVRDQEQRERLNQVESYYQDALKTEQRRSQQGFNQIAKNTTEHTEKALKNQGEAFRSDYAEHAKRLNYDVSKLEKENELLRTTDDEMKVSPFLVEKLKNKSEKHYFEKLEAERGRNTRQEEALKLRDGSERNELIHQKNQDVMMAKKEATKKVDLDRMQFSGSYEHLKADKENLATRLREEHRTEMQRSQLKSAQDLELMQRRKQDALEGQRESLNDEVRRKVTDVEFQAMVHKRETEGKFSEIRRDYERKLIEQQDHHEMTLKEQRVDFDARLQDQKRKLTQVSNDQVHALEHLLKQQEISSKERERILTERYESELDKMKRTNALLSQKKS